VVNIDQQPDLYGDKMPRSSVPGLIDYCARLIGQGASNARLACVTIRAFA
jgi:hypothetical protein